MTKLSTKVGSSETRYRDLFFALLIRNAAAAAISKFGGRAVLNAVVEPQLAVRESGNKFDIFVIDQARGVERHGVSIDDLMSDMRSSLDYACAFEARPESRTKIAANPWSPESENLTQQALLLRRNPGLAAHMRIEASKATGGKS